MSFFPVTPIRVFQERRRALAQRFAAPAVFSAGCAAPRNYPANAYPFRLASHFAYFVGQAQAGAACLVADGKSTLFVDPPDRDDALWHGPRPTLDEIKAAKGVDAVLPLADLPAVVAALGKRVATLPTQDSTSSAWLSGVLGRAVAPHTGAAVEGIDADLADAVIAVRSIHDEGAAAQLRAAAEASAAAHLAGMRATRQAKTESEVCAAITHELYRRGMADAYGPIVTVHGEILHSDRHDGALAEGDLLLCDVGGETPEGWASDITRSWPVSGKFSSTQKSIYEVVLAAQIACIDRVRPGTRYRDIQETAKRHIVSGLVELGIFRGSVDGLLDRGAAALFFPHGVGHLLGLDVHDMEDLGDRAGYAKGRSRSTAFGDRYLRLDRDLVAGMAVTIEPGFYQVPAILADESLTAPLGGDLDRDVLARYADVRGIRIEDDVLCTDAGPEVLSRACPKSVADVEAAIVG